MVDVSDEYIRERYGNLGIDEIESLKIAMKKYETPWWESEDPVTVAMYQMNEEIWMADNLAKVHEGVEKILDRPVLNSEFFTDGKRLAKAVSEAIPRYFLGLKNSKEEKSEKLLESLVMLQEFCRKNNISFIQTPNYSKN